MSNKNTIIYYIKEYFEKHLDEEVKQGDIVDYVFKFIPKARDPWRAVRMLFQQGWLVQVRKGVYKRIKGYQGHNITAPFPPKIKEEIFKQDDYRCVVCGNGLHNGFDIHADHITPQYKGGENTLKNGQTLCSEHNLMKKRYGTTDFLEKYSKKMINLSRQYNDEKTEDLFKDILKVVEEHKEKISDQ